MDIRDERGDAIDITRLEVDEQRLAAQYVDADDTVIELGARYGSVSCTINAKLRCKTAQVVVEPDARVWDALERNKRANMCEFHIVKGFVSRQRLGLTNLEDYYGGYGATFVDKEDSTAAVYTLDGICAELGMQFTALVADCEGFLERFLDENPTLYDTLRLVIFEADYPQKCDYAKIRRALEEKGFTEKVGGFQNVWTKRGTVELTNQPALEP
jgi:FkbM family methyltransferase